MDWKDKTAIVTGGASGIGRAICELLAEKGAVIVVADINSELAETTAVKINNAGGRARGATVDVTDPDAVAALIDETIAEHGRLDFMFNNAGIALVGESRNMSSDQWQHIIDVNLHGVLNGTTAAYTRMIEQGFGHIVNTASMAGLIAMSIATAYSMTKHAVVGLSTSLRAEAADLGVKVSVVCPGFIDTPIKESSTYLGVDKQRMLDNFPLKLHSPQYCARVILKGVKRNKAIITVTPLASIGWLLFRISPALVIWSSKFAVRELRTKYRDRIVENQ
jgi:NAD(P)-dependent dehydrogenase (short-subunit alcohol dehydrogenase family)